MHAVLPGLIDGLRSGVASEMADVLMQLAQILDTVFDEDAEALCEYLRVSGSISQICTALEHESPSVHQPAMLLVGNLASTAVDPQAEKTKTLLKHHAAFKRVLGHIFDTDWATLVYALSAMQVCEHAAVSLAL